MTCKPVSIRRCQGCGTTDPARFSERAWIYCRTCGSPAHYRRAYRAQPGWKQAHREAMRQYRAAAKREEAAA